MNVSRNGSGCFRFTIIKVDGLTGKRLAGAVFHMAGDNGCLTRAITNDQGIACFSINPCILYRICETTAPYGYQMSGNPIHVYLDCYGRVYLNGCCTSSCYVVVPNCPIERRFCFTIQKVDGHTGAALSDATFILLHNTQIIDTVTSGQNGDMTFRGLLPGRYQLLESIPPPGYVNNAAQYEVVITNTGNISINGYPAQGYVIPNMQGSHLIFQKVAITGDDESDALIERTR